MKTTQSGRGTVDSCPPCPSSSCPSALCMCGPDVDPASFLTARCSFSHLGVGLSSHSPIVSH